MSEKKRRSPIKRTLLILGFFIIFALIGASIGTIAGIIGDVPSLDQVVIQNKMTTTIVDRHGETLTQLYTENRLPVRLRDVPDHVINAFIATEDRYFYSHRGFDIKGIARAALGLIRTGDISAQGGGSTITQQLARLLFLTLDRTWDRKIKELVWSIQIERKFTKDEILEAYLNTVYYGHGTYGIESASLHFFGKPVSEVNLHEGALLAGVINGPGYFSPYFSMEGALNRRNIVLLRMRDAGYIDDEQYEAAKNEPIEVVGLQERETHAPYFVRHINSKLQRELGFSSEVVYGGGLTVYTTLDLELQQKAEEALRQMVPAYRTDRNGIRQPQASIVTIDVDSGHILAWVGGRGDSNDQYDRAGRSWLRSPGSAYKPFVFAAAMETLDYTAATIRQDEPTTYTLVGGSTYTPRNNDGQYAGDVTLRTALERSINTVATQIMHELTPARAIRTIKNFGLSTLVESGPVNDVTLASALGGLTQGVSPVEMASAYGVFASGGILVEPVDILRVEGPNGAVLYESRPPRKQLVISPETSYIMTDIMKGVLTRGTGVAANINRPAAGKTGTTDDYRDGWFVGFTPDIVTAVWIGEDDTSPMRYEGGQVIGSGLAARLWKAYMEQAVEGTIARDFARPEGIVGPLTIDVTNGKLISAGCTNVPEDEQIHEIFTRRTEPTEVSERCSALLQPPSGFLRWFQ